MGEVKVPRGEQNIGLGRGKRRWEFRKYWGLSKGPSTSPLLEKGDSSGERENLIRGDVVVVCTYFLGAPETT